MKELRSLQQVFQSQKLMALLVLGFTSGLPLFLTSRTLQQWMQDAKVDIGTITLFGLVSLPYSLKFLWSPLLDRFAPPVLGLRRGWLLLTQIGLLIAIGALAWQQPAQNPQILQLLALNCLVIAFLSATQDIAGDAYRTDILQPNELESGASVWVLGYRVALFAAYSLALFMADFLPWNVVYLTMATLMIPGIVATLRASEPPRLERHTATSLSLKDTIPLLFIVTLVASLFGGVLTNQIQISKLYWVLAGVLVGWLALAFVLPKRTATRLARRSADRQEGRREDRSTESFAPEPLAPESLQDAVVLPFQDFFQRFGLPKASTVLLFIVLYKLGDSLVGIAGNLFLREIGVTKTEIAAIQGGLGLVATSLGVLVGGVIMTKIGIHRSLWVFGILQLVSNVGYYVLALTGKNYLVLPVAISIENFCAGLVTVAMVAYLMSLCSHTFTTTQFALFSSLMAISRDLLSAPGGELAKATGWPIFFLITLVAAVPGLLLLPIAAPWNLPNLSISTLSLNPENEDSM
jgi:MFS transporter, PAT family, beta-lactamase induction signal transducer AmpG